MSERFPSFRSGLSKLLLAGLILRLILMPFTSHPYDFAVLYRVNNDMLAGLDVYTTNSFNYPPLWAYVEYPTLWLCSSFLGPSAFGVRVDSLILSVPAWKLPPIVTSPLLNTIGKAPFIMADTLVGIVIYSIVRKSKDEKRARFCFALWFLNPLVIAVDSIHGQFDVLPALMTVLAFCLLCNRNYIASGTAIALGSLFKIYPIFQVPLYLFSVAALEVDRALGPAGRLKPVVVGSLRFLAGFSIPLLIFLFPLLGGNFSHDVFARVETIPSLGGLTIFNIVYCPGLEGLLPFISSHLGLVSLSLVSICFVVTLCVSYIVFLKRRNFLEAFILGHLAVFLTTYLTSLTVNPQYVLWVLPFLVLSYGLYGYNLRKLSVLSVSALVFLIGLSGPLFFFYPLAMFTPALSVETIHANVYFFEQVEGWVLLLLSGISGAAVLILCLKDTLTHLLKKSRTSSPIQNSMNERQRRGETISFDFRSRWASPLGITAVILVISLAGQALVYTQPFAQQKCNLTVSSINILNDEIRLEYTLKSGAYPMDMHVLVTPYTFKTHAQFGRNVLIYYDKDYPSSLIGKAGWIGLLDHIPVELRLGGYGGSVKIVDADGLREAMLGDYDSVVIIPSGVLPEAVHAHNKSLVGNWLNSGGTLVWMGDAFAYLSGSEEKGIELFSADNLSSTQNQVLTFTLFNETARENERYASLHSDFSRALDLQYPDAYVGARVADVCQHSGVVLGKITDTEDARTSIAQIPVGSGYLLLFGGGVGRAFTATGEDVIAHDIAQILCSGFPFSSRIVSYDARELDRHSEASGSITVTYPSDKNTAGVVVVAFSKSPYVRFVTSQFCPIIRL